MIFENYRSIAVNCCSKKEFRAVLMMEQQFPAIYQQLISISSFASSSARHF